MAGELVAVGRVGRARGVRGEVFVEPWTDAAEERFTTGAVLSTRDAPLTVEAASLASGKLVVRFAGIGDRSAADALRGTELFVPAGERPALGDPDEFYDSDLVGLAAHTPDGAALGPVTEVVHAAGASYLVLRIDGQDRLVPFVRAVVPHVDVAAGTVTVDPPPGLFEL